MSNSSIYLKQPFPLALPNYNPAAVYSIYVLLALSHTHRTFYDHKTKYMTHPLPTLSILSSQPSAANLCFALMVSCMVLPLSGQTTANKQTILVYQATRYSVGNRILFSFLISAPTTSFATIVKKAQCSRKWCPQVDISNMSSFLTPKDFSKLRRLDPFIFGPSLVPFSALLTRSKKIGLPSPVHVPQRPELSSPYTKGWTA
jgi:hypothetical protein